MSCFGDLGTTMKENNISVDAIFLTIYQLHHGKCSRIRLAKLMKHYNPLTDLNNKFVSV